MALTHHLEIYQSTYQFLKLVVTVTRNFPKEFKRLIGDDLRNETTAMVALIYRANVASDKVQHIEQLRERLQVVELFLRLSLDMRWISPKQYGALTRMTQSIGRQSTGWLHRSKASPVE
jgi:hypothetical protein